MIDFRRNVSLGVRWLGIGHFFNYFIQFILYAILARLLSPKDFGALGVAFSFYNIAFIFGELGFSSALVQRKELRDIHKTITFWISFSFGLVFLLVGISLSSFLASFFKTPLIKPLVLLLSFNFFINSLGVVHLSLLKRDLFFKKISLVEIFSGIISLVTTLILVFRGWGIISLGWGYLSASFLRVVLLWVNYRFLPTLEINWEAFLELFYFGRNIFGFRVISYLSGNIDIFLIAKLLGQKTLGYYSLALSLVNIPRQKISFIVSQVMFPALSKIQDNLSEIRNAYYKLIRYASAINFPLMIGLIFIAPYFVKLVYSSRWEAMIIPLQILSVYGLVFSLSTFLGSFFNSLGRPDCSFKLGLVSSFILILAILSTFKFGLRGLSFSLVVYSLFVNIIGNIMLFKIIKGSFLDYLNSVRSSFLSSLIMSVGLFLLVILSKRFLISDILLLFIMIGLGGVIYLLSFYLIDRATFKELLTIIKEIL